MHLTPVELSLLGPCLTALVAIASLIFNQRATNRALRHQYEMALGEGLRQRRADVYLDLLDERSRWWRHNASIGQPEEPNLSGILSRLMAFGSHEVVRTTEEWRDAVRQKRERWEINELSVKVFNEVQYELRAWYEELSYERTSWVRRKVRARRMKRMATEIPPI